MSERIGVTEKLPVGTVAGIAKAVENRGSWMVANGVELSRLEYKELFKKIGTSYGIGDGKSTFNIPSLFECSSNGSAVNSFFIKVKSEEKIMLNTGVIVTLLVINIVILACVFYKLFFIN